MQFDSSICYTSFDSALGRIRVAATDQGLAGIWFDGQRHQPDHGSWSEQPEHTLLRSVVQRLQRYLACEREGCELARDLPLDLRGGTAFQQAVWRALLAIGYGHSSSYGAIAAQLGRPRAVRAVGGAVGRNPIAIIVPCHRVMGADGSLTGYAGGLDRKQALLAIESA